MPRARRVSEWTQAEIDEIYGPAKTAKQSMARGQSVWGPEGYLKGKEWRRSLVEQELIKPSKSRTLNPLTRDLKAMYLTGYAEVLNPELPTTPVTMLGRAQTSIIKGDPAGLGRKFTPVFNPRKEIFFVPKAPVS